jgi:tetratricopeptide (TPR) repeat protein
VFAYADAAAHWQRAIELYEAEPGTDLGDGVDLPHLYIRAMDALDDSGDRVRAGAIAEDAYRRFADLPDRTVAAVIHYRAAHFRAVHSPAEGLPLIREAFRLFEGTPPSDEHARAWVEYAYNFLYQGEGRHTAAEIRTALHRGLEVAEAAGAASQIAQILALLAMESFLRGDLEDGFRLFDQARNQPGDAWAALEIAILESNVFLKVGRLQDATRVGQTGFDAARQAGLGGTADAAISLCNAVEGLLARGRVGEAAALIDPDTTGPVDWVHWPLLRLRADMDLVRGEVELAAQRLASIEIGGSEHALDVEQDIAEAALWADRSEEALEAVQRALERQADTVWVIYCGWLLAMGMRACADLAEQARALRDQPATQAALVAADDLASWVSRTDGAAFNEHPFVAIIPPARATWDTEHGRATGASDPAAWSVAAERWEALGYRHRAGCAAADGDRGPGPARPHRLERPRRAGRVGGTRGRARVRVDRAGAGRAAAARPGQNQPGDSGCVVHQPSHGRCPRHPYPAQARRHHSGAGSHHRRPRRPALRRDPTSLRASLTSLRSMGAEADDLCSHRRPA